VIVPIFVVVGLCRSSGANAQAADPICGAPPSPPPIAKSEQERLKGTMDGRAELLSKKVASGNLSGAIDKESQAIYQDSQSTIAGYEVAMLLHSTCMLISQDPTLSGLQKAQAIAEIHRRRSSQTDTSPAEGKVTPSAIANLLNWLSPGTTVEQAQKVLANKEVSWKFSDDGNIVALYDTEIDSKKLKTYIFFNASKNFYYGKSTTGSIVRSDRYDSGQQPDYSSGPDPYWLCLDAYGEILKYMSARLGPPQQPPIISSHTDQDAWNITGGRIDRCGQPTASCSSVATVKSQTAKYVGDSVTLSVTSYLVQGNVNTSPTTGYFHETNYTSCSVVVAAKIM
jgi:hypothetical protein